MNGGKSVIATMVAFGVGGALMYLFDPAAGRKRRAQTRATARRAAAKFQKALDSTSHSIDKLSRMDWKDVAKAVVPVTARALLSR